MTGRPASVAGLTLALALLVPAAASAATLAPVPQRACYRAGHSVGLLGSGFTPSGPISLTADGLQIGSANADGAGNLIGAARLVLERGQVVRTYAALDGTNTANFASIQLRVSVLAAKVRRRVRPGRRVLVHARGFTNGRVLWAHLVRRGFRRTVKVGRLKGDCHDLSLRRRLVAKGTRAGTYRVQFDTRKRYSRKTKVKVRRTLKVQRAKRSRR